MRKLQSLTIVTPCFNEEASIEQCVLAVRRVMGENCPAVRYRHLLVDNSSTDRTVEILTALATEDHRLQVLVNSRNVGASRSMLHALRFCHSQACIPFLPADLQDPPDLIPQLVKKWEEGYDRVIGIRCNRRESYLLRKSRSLYYRILSKLSSTEIQSDAGEFQLIDASVVAQVAKVEDHYPFVRGLIAMTGAKSACIEYDWETRKEGSSKASLLHLFDLGINGLLSTSKIPARLIFLSGALTSLVSFLYTAAVMLVSLMVGSDAAPGVNTVVLALFFFSGVQLMSIALIGEYVISIHSQVRQGPKMFVSRSINLEQLDTEQ